MANDVHMPLAIDDIEIPDGRRQAKPDVVRKLAESIEKIGLQHPVTVRRKGERYVLVAGLHRIEAFRRLKREHIPALITSFTNTNARLWEIAENLHRAELTVQERADHIEEWRSLTADKGAQVGHPLGGVQPHNDAISAAAREFGMTRQDVQRAVKIASISDEAKEAAREARLDDNQSALLKVASAPRERQVATVTELATRKIVKPADRPLDDIETKEKWLAAGMSWWNRGCREWREEFLARVDKPVMTKWGSAPQS